MAQTTCAHINHFYKSVLGALEFDGPAIVVLLHDLPAGARRGRQHGRRAGPAGGRYAGVPAADLRSPQGRHDQGAAVAAGQPGREGRLVRSTRRRARRSTSSTSPAAKAASPSTSTRTATRRRRCWRPSRTGSRTGTCCRSWPASSRSPVARSLGWPWRRPTPRPAGVLPTLRGGGSLRRRLGVPDRRAGGTSRRPRPRPPQVPGVVVCRSTVTRANPRRKAAPPGGARFRR